MLLKLQFSQVVVVGSLAMSQAVHGFDKRSEDAEKAAKAANVPVSTLWNDRGDLASLDTKYGAGGKEHEPSGKFTFVEEDEKGGSPKFIVTDEQGVKWKAKLGDEARSETAASRLLWALGYFTDEDYYMPMLQVENLPRLNCGDNFVERGGVVRGVRLERKPKGEKRAANWSWFKNPLAGTREMDGLRVMMAMMNNWD